MRASTFVGCSEVVAVAKVHSSQPTKEEKNVLKPTRFLTMALLVAALALAAAACGGSDNGSDTGSTSDEGSSADATSAEGLKDPGKRVIGVLPVNLGSEYLAKKTEQTKATVEPLGWEVIIVDGAADPVKMEAGMQSLVTQGVDAIFTMSIGGEEIPQGFAAAKRAEIPVFAIVTDVNPDQVENWTGVWADSNSGMGEIMGNYIGENLSDQPVIGWDITQNFSGHAYVEGVEAGLAEHDMEYSDLRDTDLADLVNSMTKQAEALVQANKGPQTFVDLSDFGSPLFLPVFERAGRDDITLTTRYDNASTLALMEDFPTMRTIASEGYEYIFDVVEAVLNNWVNDEPFPTEPDNKSVANGTVIGSEDYEPGAEEFFEFQPALEEKLAEWGETYQLSE